MGKDSYSGWAKYLRHPLVFIGFVFMLFSGLIKTVLSDNILKALGEGAGQSVQKGLIFAFVLGLVVIVLGFMLAFKRRPREKGSGDSMVQKTKGDQSPAVAAKGDVKITYGSAVREEKENESPDTKD